MTDVTAEALAEAFGLTPPIGNLEPLPHRGFKQFWCLDTGDGRVLVKQFWPYDDLPWRDRYERIMELERRALRAGIDTPAPLVPVRPAFGSVARIEGYGLFRAFPYVRHRTVGRDDDLAEWAGATLAHIHQLWPLDTRPDPNWWYGQDPRVPHGQWLDWLDEGERDGRSWAPALREQLDFVLDQSTRVLATFNASPPYVVSHLDFKPSNVLLAGDRPIVIDWDSAGWESVPLESAYVFVDFAGRAHGLDPDPEVIRRAHAAYIAAGGEPLVVRTGSLDRVIGQHLATITTALGGYFQGGHSEEQIRARIEYLPKVVAKARSWEQTLAEACDQEGAAQPQ
ncbi:phosphotransferase enzyme family protein [Flindersiella endophytica]